MSSLEWAARARIKMFEATGDERHLTRPHYRIDTTNPWDKVWVEDNSIQELIQTILKEKKE